MITENQVLGIIKEVNEMMGGNIPDAITQTRVQYLIAEKIVDLAKRDSNYYEIYEITIKYLKELIPRLTDSQAELFREWLWHKTIRSKECLGDGKRLFESWIRETWL